MNEIHEQPSEPPETGPLPAQEAAPPAASASPSLGSIVGENCDAVQDDVQQARQVAADLEKQLAGKSREMLHLKYLFDRTKDHLNHLQDNITQLRKERHKLANDAMRAPGLEMMLARVTAERDRLKSELEAVLRGLATENHGKELRFDKRDKMIAELTLDLMKARKEAEDLRRINVRPGTGNSQAAPPPDPAKAVEPERIVMAAMPDDVEIVATERVGGSRR
jgi:hypothetical protein